MINSEEYQAKLDDDILYMLRLRAMEENIVPAPGMLNHLRHREQVKGYLNSMTENEQYFKELADAIGYEEDGQKPKRVAIRIQTVRELVRHKIASVCGLRLENIRTVIDTTGYRLDRDSARYFVAQIFGFYNYHALHNAILKKGGDFPASKDKMVTIEEQDFIARTLGYKGWLDFNDRDDSVLKVTVTMLKRAFGRARYYNKIKRKKLDYIACFIADMTWDELLANKEKVMCDLERRYISRGSGQVYIGRPRKKNPYHIYSSRLLLGDKVTLSFLCGKTMTLELVDKCTFKVLDTQSDYIKVGYLLTAYEIMMDTSLRSNEVYDEEGNMLDEGYSSDTISDIHFEGVTYMKVES